MRKVHLACIVISWILMTAGACRAQSSAGAEQANAAAAAWNAIQAAPFDAGRMAHVENLTLVRDRIRITLVEGTVQFTAPAAGIVFGAAFKGRGKIEIAPPNSAEAQQLELFTKQSALDIDFSEATFSFTDDTFEEVSKQVKWVSAADNSLAGLYQRRQRTREDLDAEMAPRIFEGVLSGDHKGSAYFAADMKTGGFGWVLAKYDALEPEEISVGRYESRGTPALLFDTWMSFPAGSASAIQVDQSPLAKDVFLARKYNIDATVTGGADLSATTQVDLQYQTSGERVLVFYLSANLRVSSVKDEHGATLAFFQPRDPEDHVPTYGDYVAVVLPQATTQGQETILTFQYAGKDLIQKVGAGNYFCPSYGWYPGTTDEFAMRADFQMTFHAPKNLMLVATGDKAGESTDGKWTTTKWSSQMPQSVAGFAFGDYKVYQSKVGDISVEVYGNRNPDDFLSSVQAYSQGDLPGQTTGQMAPMGSLDPASMLKTTGVEIGNDLRVFQDYFGPFPYQRLAVTNIPYTYGQGWPMLLYLSVFSFMDETQRHFLGITDQVRISDYFRAHEVSHQWWGHEVGWKSYHDQWLSEGFAQFSGNLYVELRDGQKKFLDRLHTDRSELLGRNKFGHRYEDLGSVWMGQRLASSVAPDGYNTVIYDKGGYVLEMLRAMLQNPRSKSPDEGFKAMMQDFTKSFSGKAASTEDFKSVVERHMTRAMDVEGNHNMDWFFNEYVYGTGIAQYHMDYTVQSQPGNKWLLSGTVTQAGVPDGWKDILPLYLHMGGKSGRIGWLKIVGKSTPFKVVLGFRPDKVSLNDNSEILAEIK
ncbi:MAG TPA: M1 family aminopeptidase [Candidatus Acidoferrales bacterium]|nr:M1 family aminopeptidase [Candidatus Acidoferrales bacterium]